MRRKNKKGRVRTNKTIRRCPSCQKNFKDEINDNVAQAIINEKAYAYEDYYEDDFESERKRLNKKYPDEEEEEIKEKKEPSTKHEIKKEMWKKTDKKFIMKEVGKYKSKAIGNPIHGYAMIKAKHEDRIPKCQRKSKGVYRNPPKLKTFCKDSNVEQAIEELKTLPELLLSSQTYSSA